MLGKILHKAIVFVLPLIILSGCSDDEEFAFDIDHLTGTTWGIPMIVEPGDMPIDLDAPTIFSEDGSVQIGPSRFDFWRIRGSRSLFLEQSSQIWFIIDLDPNRLYVEKTTHPEGIFIVKCIYEPMK